MKRFRWLIILVVLIAAGVGYFYLWPKIRARNVEYAYTSIHKGDIEATVSSTGTLEAINTVDVGTQISGRIARIYVDFNDRVKKGQLLAEMDMRMLRTALQTAQANLAVSQAGLDQVEDQYRRDKQLYEKKVISEQAFNSSKFSYERARSSREAARASLTTAQTNMGFARITSPIDGVIIEKKVEEGQTVAASFATPSMFIIAEDLSKMQILADVDESDIGYVRDSMPVRFTIQTYPDMKFDGRVSQIRLQPVEINNVVNYKVVIAVDNPSGKLIPGMTANIEFIVDRAEDVWLINNSALRFRPDETTLELIRPVLQKNAADALPDSARRVFLEALDNEEMFTPVNFKKSLPADIDGFLYQDEQGKLQFRFFEVGIKTGLQTEVRRFLDGSEVAESTKVIHGIKTKKRK